MMGNVVNGDVGVMKSDPYTHLRVLKENRGHEIIGYGLISSHPVSDQRCW